MLLWIYMNVWLTHAEPRVGLTMHSSSLVSKSGLIRLQIDVSTLLESLVLIFRFISRDNFKLVFINCEHVCRKQQNKTKKYPQNGENHCINFQLFNKFEYNWLIITAMIQSVEFIRWTNLVKWFFNGIGCYFSC